MCLLQWLYTEYDTLTVKPNWRQVAKVSDLERNTQSNTCYGIVTNVVFTCVCLQQNRYGCWRRTFLTARLIKLYGRLRLMKSAAAYGGLWRRLEALTIARRTLQCTRAGIRQKLHTPHCYIPGPLSHLLLFRSCISVHQSAVFIHWPREAYCHRNVRQDVQLGQLLRLGSTIPRNGVWSQPNSASRFSASRVQVAVNTRRVIIIIIIISKVLYRVSVETKRSVAAEVSITVSVQKAMSSGGSGTTEVMARPWRPVEDCSKHAQPPRETHGRRVLSVW